MAGPRLLMGFGWGFSTVGSAVVGAAGAGAGLFSLSSMGVPLESSAISWPCLYSALRNALLHIHGSKVAPGSELVAEHEGQHSDDVASI